MKESLKKAGYRYVKSNKNREHVLMNLETNGIEIWFSNKNHASYGLIWRNTHLEFARSL